jgi:hypothetical protein
LLAAPSAPADGVFLCATQKSLRRLMGEEMITHLGLEYYD